MVEDLSLTHLLFILSQTEDKDEDLEGEVGELIAHVLQQKNVRGRVTLLSQKEVENDD